MDRSNFVDRDGNRKVNFLKYQRLVSMVYSKDNGLTGAELDLLYYLDDILYFTRDHFKTGILDYGWDKRLFDSLLKQGWIFASKNGYRKKGDHNHYNLTLKAKMLVNSVYKILCGQEDLPDRCKRNRSKKNATYIEKVRKRAIEAMDADRAKKRREDY